MGSSKDPSYAMQVLLHIFQLDNLAASEGSRVYMPMKVLRLGTDLGNCNWYFATSGKQNMY